jgi:hypothetical protein
MTKFALATLLVLAAGEAAAAAARVDFVYGNVTLTGLDGREQPLVRGAQLDNGDTVRTGQGRAQLRFSDGAYVSLQPESEFAIRDYRFDGKTDGTERGFFGLVKGAMRTVSGLVGRVNRDRYQVTTPTATIGIRGTGGVIQVRDDGSTLIVGTSGIWSLTNPAGSIDVPAGVSALAPASPDAPPQRTSQAPQSGPAPLPPPTGFMQGEQRDASGNPIGIAAPAVVAVPGQAALLAYGLAGALTVDVASDLTARFNASGQLVQADVSSLTYRLDGSHADFGTDGILTWGRWIGQVTLPGGVESYSANQGLHYVVGTPTPVLPTSGVANYVLAGASRPTYVDGSTAPGAFTGSLSVTFGAQASLTGQFQAAMPDRTYAWSASGATRSADFSLATTSSSGCLGNCVITTAGFFAGAAAERIGLGYTIDDASKALVGTAAFRK